MPKVNLNQIEEVGVETLPFRDKSGIYTITNCINNKIYVGSSVNIYKRLKNHL